VSTLGIALAGAGAIGQRHAQLLDALHAESGRARLSAVVDPSDAGRAFAARQQVPWFADLDALFSASGRAGTTTDASPRVDGVILATPNTMHVSGALTCLAQGVPALIEKPVANSVQDGERLLEALQHSDVPMLVGHHRRHSSVLQAAARALASGDYGRLVSVIGSAQFYKPASYFETAPWRRQPGGGPILINLIHEMDNLRLLCGEIEAVQAMATNATRGFEVEDTAVINLRFAGGMLGTFALSDTAAGPRSWEQTSGENPDYPRHRDQDCYFICGTRGSLAVPTLRAWQYPGQDDAARSWFKPFNASQLPVQEIDPLVAQLAHFCDVIERKTAPLVSVRDALQSLRVLEAVRASVASGRLEPVAPAAVA
jgi:predicted dehydrogenase